MLHLGLPHINVLTKVDLITQYGDLGTKRAQDIADLAHLNGLL
jgi:hypothetical protein